MFCGRGDPTSWARVGYGREMFRRVIWIAAVLAAPACESKNDASKPDVSKSANPSSDKPGPSVAAAKQPAAELFTGTTVTVPALVAKVTPGMSRDEAKAAAPEALASKSSYEVPGYDGVRVRVVFAGDRVQHTTFSIKQPMDAVKAWLTQKWGAPWAPENAKDASGNPTYYWDAPDVHTRAVLTGRDDTSDLSFEAIMSFEQALGNDPNKLENVPVIGATEAELATAFAQYRPSPWSADEPGLIRIQLPALVGGTLRAHYAVRIKDGKVSGYELSISPKLNDKLVAKLEGTLGKSKPRAPYIEFAGPPKATAELRADDERFSTSVWVGDTKK